MLHYVWVYIIFFLGIFIEGELVFLSAVIAASHGHLNLWLVITIAILATITSDVVYFNLGKRRVAIWMQKSKWKFKIEAVNQKLEKNRGLFLISYRFLYGLRIATPLVLGTQKISQLEFLKFSIISTLIWAIVFTSIGWAFGEIILSYLKHIEQIEYYIIGGLLIIATVVLIVHFFRRKTVI
ncbi:DedA family protein [uncultured Salegentibacter sp.]|uniref:DedA family protein n=1 Tax=uncultured Salegentibacter sp. TaxID=259320 RepID=UPI0030DC2638|tara:strand:+ start:83 stop:628 length:546 start_codon:yes stop_codon:yes gene_type:complete